MDDAEPRDAFLRVARKATKTYPSLRLVHVARSGSASGPYRVSSIPTLYVVGADGAVRSVLSGYAGPTDELERAVRAALAKAPRGDRPDGAASLPNPARGASTGAVP